MKSENYQKILKNHAFYEREREHRVYPVPILKNRVDPIKLWKFNFNNNIKL